MNFLSNIAKGLEEANHTENTLNKDVKEMPMTRKETVTEMEQASLSLVEKTIVKIENPNWSFETIHYIESMEEYRVYKEADLTECTVGEKVALVRDDINWEQKDEFGRTNHERVKANLSPINKDGEVIELHHVGQEADSPFAELTRDEHRGSGNDTILHDKNIETHIDREEYKKEKFHYWKMRIEMEEQR